MKRRISPRFAALTVVLSLAGAAPAAGQDPGKDLKKIQKEEQEDYFKRWLEEDVAYIITEDERNVFSKLTTDEEREQFIEQFWYRRDPDLRTSNNEFKEEHYRRIAYANEHFTSGKDGWQTDRGRVYIIHGKPAEVVSHKSGQSYDRPMSEGGGFTKTVPFETWRYRYIEGLGTDVEIEFVDPSGSGEFRLARNPWEKDAMLYFGGTALTVAEEFGLASRQDHPNFSPATADNYAFMNRNRKDHPFERYERNVKIMRPTELKHDDLKQIVAVNVRYNTLPFRVRTDFFRLTEDNLLVPLTIELDNRDLSFVPEFGVHTARVAIYGIVTSMSNRLVAEFEHDLAVSYKPEELEVGLLGRAMYQKILNLDGRQRYKVDLVVRDVNSESTTVKRIGIIPPAAASDGLGSSSLILSDHIVQMDDIPTDTDEMFVIGDMKVRPSLTNSFYEGQTIGVYLHLYNAALDQSTLQPSLTVAYRVLKDGKQVRYWKDEAGQSVQFSSGRRVVLIKPIPLAKLAPGKYQVTIDVTDRLTERRLNLEEGFEVKALPVLAETGGR